MTQESNELSVTEVAANLLRMQERAIGDRDYAERILVHYFRVVGLGSKRGWEADYDAEIGGAVEAIIDAARRPLEYRVAVLEQTLAEMSERLGSLRRTLDARTDDRA